MAKYLPPSPGGIAWQRAQLDALASAKQLWLECNNDTDLWCARLGLDLIRTDVLLVEPVRTIIRGKKIYVLKGMLRNEEAYAVAHEYAHNIFHAKVTPFRDMNRYQINRDENLADQFAAALVAGNEFTF